ncbi:hypothetical protein EI94DRAFT_1818729 [Lactarius quietus]|nr:hypothetical protein EI94DRAFT_1818729 [Lactarius quietus]
MDAAPANISVSSVNGDHGSDDDEDDRHSSDDLEVDGTQGRVSHVYLPSRHEGNYPSFSTELALTFHQHNFHDLIRRFLFDQIHMHDVDTPAGSDYRMLTIWL